MNWKETLQIMAFILAIIAVFFIGSCFGEEYKKINASETEKLNMLTPRAKKVFTEFLTAARKQFPEHKIILAETYRTQKRQNALFKKGKNTTTVKVSMHTKRLAADIYFVNGKRILEVNEAPYKELAKMAVSLGLTAGFYWRVPFDPGHYELRGEN